MIILLLSFVDFNKLDRGHVQLVNQHFTFLTEVINIHGGLLDSLIQEKVISSNDAEEIREGRTNCDKNYTLLMMLMKKSALDFELFLTALEKSSQSHIADVLSVHVNSKFNIWL